MQHLLSSVKINVSEGLYLKDPDTSDLGRQILSKSIIMIDELGFEMFTFKKLGQEIGSNESSIYRYFENKHKLLLYLAAYYWTGLEYRLVFATHNIENPVKKLEKAIEILTELPVNFTNNPSINQVLLRNIVISEFSKSYHNKSVDSENNEGYYSAYKKLILRVVDLVIEVDKNYLFPKCLVSDMLAGALHQHFLSDHFKSLTECGTDLTPTDFYKNLFSKQLNIDFYGK
jgi:AcrR family transcriptional regulator